MVDEGFPDQHTTTTTVTSSNTTVQTNIRYDPSYVRTVPGILKCCQVVLNLLVFLSVTFSHFSNYGTMSFMSLICGFAFWFSGILLILYLFHVIEKFFKIPWLKIELIFCGIWTIFLLIGSTISASHMGASAVFIFVSLFGYLNMIGYGYDAFLKYKAIQNGEIAQGERIIHKTVTSSPTSPAAY